MGLGWATNVCLGPGLLHSESLLINLSTTLMGNVILIHDNYYIMVIDMLAKLLEKNIFGFCYNSFHFWME